MYEVSHMLVVIQQSFNDTVVNFSLLVKRVLETHRP